MRPKRGCREAEMSSANRALVRALLISVAGALALIASLEARPHAETAPFIAPEEGALLNGEIERWWSRAEAWYERPEGSETLSLKDKRRQMRGLTRAVGRGCYGCHSKGFKGYNDKGLISAQMMAVSAEHGVACEACHVGARGLSELGARALLMWRYSVSEGLDCADCHPKAEAFKSLNERGERSAQEVERALKRLAEQLGLPQELSLSKRHQEQPEAPPLPQQ